MSTPVSVVFSSVLPLVVRGTWWSHDWVLVLPAELEARFQVELAQFEAERNMPYVTSVERMGIEKGIQQGIQQGVQQGEASLLKRLLVRRFGPLPEWVEHRLAQAKPADLERWAERVLEAQSLEEVLKPSA